jgi:hypothetical protein
VHFAVKTHFENVIWAHGNGTNHVNFFIDQSHMGLDVYYNKAYMAVSILLERFPGLKSVQSLGKEETPPSNAFINIQSAQRHRSQS